ncbi:hypothetical protein AVEN_39209-1 [Araneus ventricosus]|uniref:Uncharacterized protein n=1 Tax=Araneus ventricosus TaxID=182803 RepID=A0A4Y2NJY5_ARAVE|nr:hypothetical protein AVEN_39209-1 [Araneus ventricosus]
MSRVYSIFIERVRNIEEDIPPRNPLHTAFFIGVIVGLIYNFFTDLVREEEMFVQPIDERNEVEDVIDDNDFADAEEFRRFIGGRRFD